ncbi:hypothetical protein GTH32_04680 [Alteromonas sp. 345S023]|uniref:Sialate O-acetylesterase domain-containing protein n=1 Tax=Alteromonas profundi TaxID=2696062 RepID=A0A7X5LJK2_9ALTE|nr:sialate O-acetylesterase [Alteromonas profundi]NDV90493.1 hypothetical protein [Alteromonas profundi]
MKSSSNKRFTAQASLYFTLNILAFIAVLPVKATVTLLPQYADDMVLQRDKPNNVQGYSDKPETIEIYMDGVKLHAAEVQEGPWSLTLPAQTAGGPHKLGIRTSSQWIELNNVLFGDIWLASGQSNMEYTLGTLGSDYEAEIRSVDFDQIRQFRVERNAAYSGPLAAIANGHWTIAKGKDLQEFSAVGYFFAKHVYAHTGIPIAIINNAFAGARIQAWMSESALTAYPNEVRLLKRNKEPYNIEQLRQLDETRYQQWQEKLAFEDLGFQHNWFTENFDDSQWAQLTVPGFWTSQGQEAFSGSMWFRRTFWVTAEQANKAANLVLGRIVDQDEVYVNGAQVGSTRYQYPQRIYSLTPGLLKTGLNQITVRVVSHRSDGQAGFVPSKPYHLRFNNSLIPLGGLWRYRVGHRMNTPIPSPAFKINEQPSGLYNAMLAPLANTQLKGVIWYQGESNAEAPMVYRRLFPAMITQWRALFSQPTLPFLYVQLANYMAAQTDPSIAGWANIRAAQANGLTLDNTAMITAIDLGEWNDIHPKNKAAVGQRLAFAALKEVYNKPGFSYQGPVLTCAERVSDFEIRVHSESSQLELSNPDDKVQGFAISENDIDYQWVEGELEPTSIILHVKDANKIKTITYAWQSNPNRANLTNNNRLPAYPAKLPVKHRCNTGVE